MGHAWPPPTILRVEGHRGGVLCPPVAGGSEQARRSAFASLFHSCTGRSAAGSQLASWLSAPWFLAPSLLVQMLDSGPVAVNLDPGDSAPGSWLQGLGCWLSNLVFFFYAFLAGKEYGI